MANAIDALLTGPVTDQAALQGLLRAVRDLGMRRVSVTPVSFEKGACKMNSALIAPPATSFAAVQATTMKAIVQDRYGSPDVLILREVVRPEPLDDEVLVRIHAAAVNTADWIALTGRPYAARLAFGLLRPKLRIPGIAMAG